MITLEDIVRVQLLDLISHPDDAGHERCGVLIGARVGDDWKITHAIPVANTADNASHTHEMRVDDVVHAIKVWNGVTGDGITEDDIIGAYHTHPRPSSADPSVPDVEAMIPGMLGLVLHEASRTFTYFTHESGFIKKENHPNV